MKIYPFWRLTSHSLQGKQKFRQFRLQKKPHFTLHTPLNNAGCSINEWAQARQLIGWFCHNGRHPEVHMIGWAVMTSVCRTSAVSSICSSCAYKSDLQKKDGSRFRMIGVAVGLSNFWQILVPFRLTMRTNYAWSPKKFHSIILGEMTEHRSPISSNDEVFNEPDPWPRNYSS